MEQLKTQEMMSDDIKSFEKNIEYKECLNDILNHLTKEEAEIIKWRFGFYDSKKHTFKELSRKLYLSPQKVKDIEEVALAKIKLLNNKKRFFPNIAPFVEKNEYIEDIIKINNIEMNVKVHMVTLDSKPIYLRPKEFDLLLLFLKNPNVVLKREYILENVFKYSVPFPSRRIDTHIKNLRKALGYFGDKIITVFGYGFKLDCPK